MGLWKQIDSVWQAAAKLKSKMQGPIMELSDRGATPADERQEIIERYRDDPFLLNYHLNLWEYKTGQVILNSYPWSLSLPISNVCNAKCDFCSAWLQQVQSFMQIDQVERLSILLKYAKTVGLVGYGEPLINPHLEEIVARCRAYMDDRATFYTITNGATLEKKLPVLLRHGVKSFKISVNAASDETHHNIMDLGRNTYSRVVATVKEMVEHRNLADPYLYVSVSLILCQSNLSEAPDFVRLFNEIGVNQICIRTLAPLILQSAYPGLNYHLLPPYLHPEFPRLSGQLKEEIDRCTVAVECDPDSWGVPILSEALARACGEDVKVYSKQEALSDFTILENYASHATKALSIKGRGLRHEVMSGYDRAIYEEETGFTGNPLGREPPFECGYIYHFFQINDVNFSSIPCCYLNNVPGHEMHVLDDECDFMKLWNSPAYVDLRTRLRSGPLYKMCKLCQEQGRRV